MGYHSSIPASLVEDGEHFYFWFVENIQICVLHYLINYI